MSFSEIVNVGIELTNWGVYYAFWAFVACMGFLVLANLKGFFEKMMDICAKVAGWLLVPSLFVRLLLEAAKFLARS